MASRWPDGAQVIRHVCAVCIGAMLTQLKCPNSLVLVRDLAKGLTRLVTSSHRVSGDVP